MPANTKPNAPGGDHGAELCDLTAHELADLLDGREVKAVEVTESVLRRIETSDATIKAYMTITPEAALETARRVDAARAAAHGGANGASGLGRLAGIPVALKDNMCMDGVRTTCSSRILEDFVPPYDATVVARLKEANAVLLGKTNLDEFAMGSSTENSAFFTTRNPWDTACVPGGSSGGSAAAVAAGEAILSLGSDTGGSIRQPAAFCGVVGLKPTYGYVSRFGLIAFASSLDQIGPFSRDVEDAALMMNVIAGHDPKDATSVPIDVPDFTSFLTGDVRGLRVGVPAEYFIEGIEQVVKDAVRRAIDTMAKLGAEIIDISLPHTEYALATYYLIAPSEASSNLARYDGVRYGYRAEGQPDVLSMYKKTRSQGFGAEVKRRIMLGTYALSSGYYDAYYLKAQKVRTLFVQDFARAFEKVDVIMTPTTPTVPFKVGERADNPLAMYLSDLFTIPANLAALPALSLPCAFTDDGGDDEDDDADGTSAPAGLPIGVQFMGPAFGEGTVFRAAHALERELKATSRRPPVAASRPLSEPEVK